MPNAVAFSPDGQMMASGSEDRSAKLWQASNGNLLQTLVQCGGLRCNGVNFVRYSPDGQTLVTAGSGVRFWSVSDGTLLRTLNIGGQIDISPDWQYIASSVDNSGYATDNRSVALFRVSDGTQLRTMTGGGGAVAFSPDGQIVASVSARHGIDMWRVSDGTLIRNIAGPKKLLLFSPDGQYIVSAGGAPGLFKYDDTLEVYRVSDGTLVRTITATGILDAITLAPDGQTIVATGWETNAEYNSIGTQSGTLQFWRLSDGAHLKTYDLETGTYTGGVAVSPDSSLFAYTTSDNNVRVAHMPSLQCAFSTDQIQATYQKQGGSGTIQVSAPEGCSWTAYSRVSWVHITSGSTGSGSGTVTYSVDPSNICDSQSPEGYYIDGLLVIAEQIFDVSQNLCPVGPRLWNIYGTITDNTGQGLSGITITLSGGQSATTQTDSTGHYSFNNLMSGMSYTVTPSGSLYNFTPQSKTIDSLTYHAWEDFKASPAPVCSFSLSNSDLDYPCEGGSGTVNIESPSGCSWTATTDSSWITITSASATTVTYEVDMNTGPARTGTLTIAGQTVLVQQSGGCLPPPPEGGDTP